MVGWRLGTERERFVRMKILLICSDPVCCDVMLGRVQIELQEFFIIQSQRQVTVPFEAHRTPRIKKATQGAGTPFHF